VATAATRRGAPLRLRLNTKQETQTGPEPGAILFAAPTAALDIRNLSSPRERPTVKGVFLALEVKEQPMMQAIVLTVAVAVCIALTKRGRPNAPALRKGYASRDSFDKFEMSANNLKAAVKKVDNSAAAVEVALKGLMAA
jgi:hypothetical protein